MVPGRQVVPPSSVTSSTPSFAVGAVRALGCRGMGKPYATQCSLVGQLRLSIAALAGNGVTVKCLPPSVVAMNSMPRRTSG